MNNEAANDHLLAANDPLIWAAAQMAFEACKRSANDDELKAALLKVLVNFDGLRTQEVAFLRENVTRLLAIQSPTWIVGADEFPMISSRYDIPR